MQTKICGHCGKRKPLSDFSKDKTQPDGLNNKCKEDCKKYWRKYADDHGIQSMAKNRACSQFLGITVAEKVLSMVFDEVLRMPLHNHGYDFICKNGYKIEVKSSCLYVRSEHHKQWQFDIAKNKIANYFLLIAFNNRIDLEPRHVWLVPANELNNFNTASIAEGSPLKWSKWEKPIDKVMSCCESLKTQETISNT